MSDVTIDLKGLANGDEDAWTRAFRILWRYARHAALTAGAGLSPDEAEDVAVIALTQLVAQVGKARSVEHLKALLLTISQRQAISVARGKSALKRPQIALHLDALPENEAEAIVNRQQPGGSVGDDTDPDKIELLHRALNSLDDETRRLLLARVIEGKSYAELSAEFQMSEGALRVKFSRALKELARRLKRPGK